MPRIQTPLLLLAAAATLSAVALAHDDDPKVLDRLPPYAGPGIRTGVPSVASGAVTPSVKGGGGVQKAVQLGRPFPQEGVQLLSWVTLQELWNMEGASNCWGYTAPSGREYALLGLSHGTGFVEISDPGNPQPVALVPAPESTWHDVRTYQQYAYAVSEGGAGIQVIDLSQIDAGVVTLVKKVFAGGTAKTHTMTINEDSGFLYRSGGGNNGLRIYSLANPANPVFVGEWQYRYVHAATVVSYTSGPYAGREIAFCCGGFNGGFQNTGVDILDVTNKNNIQYLSHTSYSGPGYAHQAWPSEDLRYLYVGDELDEDGSIKTTTKILDIANLSNPIELPEFTSSKQAIGHNIYVKGDLIFEANYTAGMRVFDASDPVNPVETKWFDTFPDGNGASFNGLWHVYPYFPSGAVIGSDIERGLFVWWVDDPLLVFEFPTGQPDLFDPAGQTVQVQIIEQNAGDLVAGSEEFHVDSGSGWVSAPMTNLGAGQYQIALPPTTCGDEIRYYFTAQSSNDITWTDPPGAPGMWHHATAATSKSAVLFEDIELSPLWSRSDPDDDATGGRWVRNNPQGTVANPYSDHSQPGKKCYFTGNSTVGLTPTEADVDGGKTTLTTVPYDLSGYAEPVIGYWRWYSNHSTAAGSVPNEDVFVVEVTSDGTSWVNVETVGPTGPEVAGGWIHHQFRLQDFAAPTSSVQLRFIASDYNQPSLVEAAIDDFEVFELGCSSGVVSYCTAGTSASGCQAALSANGTPSASATSGFDLSADGVEGDKDGLFFFGSNGRQANAWGSSTSYQCVTPPVIRAGLLAGSGSTGACDGSFSADLNALWCSTCPKPSKNPGAGALVQAQLWYRDPQNTSNQTTSLSDALEFTVQP